MKMSENWKKANVIEKISIIMVILTALFISVTGLLNFFFNIDLFFYYQTIQSFAVSWLLFLIGILNWRSNRVFAFLFLLAAITVFLKALKYSPLFWWYTI